MTRCRAASTGIALAVIVPILGGCLSIPSSVSDLMPFSKKEEIVPGERRSALPAAVDNVSGGTASISSAVAMNDWSQPGGNAANAPGHVALAGGGGASVFRAKVMDGGKKAVRASAPPLVHGGQIFVYSATGTVSGLSGGGGRSWSVSLKPEKEKSAVPGGGIAASSGTIFAATGFGEVAALSAANGSKIWSYDLGAPARSAPTAAGGKVYVVTVNNVLHAINMADGTEAWTFPGIPETAGVLSGASPAVSGNTVVVPYSSGEVTAFSTADGDLKWADAVIRSSRTRAISGLTDVAASPVIVGDVVYATGVAGRTIAVKLASGERVWEKNIGSSATPAVSGNALFLVDLDDNMVAMERSSGNILWRTALPVIRKKRFYSTWTGPTLAGGALWAVSNDKQLLSVDPATGQLLGNRKLQASAYQKPIAVGGRLYVLSGDGALTAYQ